MQDPTADPTPKQVKVLTALLAGRSVEAPAKEAGVNPATVHRWLKDEAFKAARDAGQRELAELGLSLLLSLVRRAVAVQLERLDDRTKPQLQQRASEFVIDHGLKWIELESLEARLKDLEERYAQTNQR
jgi:AcrR family transcriptional regulator